jgi:hypothetical protein
LQRTSKTAVTAGCIKEFAKKTGMLLKKKQERKVRMMTYA